KTDGHPSCGLILASLLAEGVDAHDLRSRARAGLGGFGGGQLGRGFAEGLRALGALLRRRPARSPRLLLRARPFRRCGRVGCLAAPGARRRELLGSLALALGLHTVELQTVWHARIEEYPDVGKG